MQLKIQQARTACQESTPRQSNLAVQFQLARSFTKILWGKSALKNSTFTISSNGKLLITIFMSVASVMFLWQRE
jgi:hypothetical protein